MTMLPRSKASASMATRPVSSASIANRLIASAGMAFRKSVALITRHFNYNQSTQPYESDITYNYSTSNGDMVNRPLVGASMEGRN